MLPKDVDNKLISFQKYVIGLRKQKKYLLSHIGNMDETPVAFDMIGNKTIDMKGTKSIHIKSTGHEKSHLTVVLSCLADGTKLKPIVIFKRKTVPKSNFPKVYLSNSLDGTEDDSLFLEESNRDGENDTDFDDVPEDITEDEYVDLFICQVIYSQFGLAIHQNDHQARRRFVEWAQNEIAVVPYFHKRIWFSDEAHFWLNGYVNKQNCRIWSEANPQVYVETPLHPEKLTVWCALWAGGILLQNDEGHNVTVNGDRYRAMITNFFIPELNNHDVQELWFQQDGATCHTARATIDLLKDTFGDRLISRFGPVNWPPRSCDLTPLDYFLWGYVKSLVYADKPQTLDHLEDNIRRVIADIRPQMLEKVIENWTSRLDYIRASRGSPMPEIIFKM
ncbi:pogo transposable element with KRAB domain [Trichonephila clavipes]|nr:pogo transposable element with KRAB domain [Trichonephila clavipes]